MDLKFDEKQFYRFDDAVHITPNSELYKAMDLTLGRNVALKKVKVNGSNKREVQANYQRAIQEVKTMVQITELTAKIPNIYGMYFDEGNADLYIIMQWINGETLADKMQHNVSGMVFVRWMQELAGILNVMSQKHFCHKDIKPDNIMFNTNDDLYLIDFNISVSVPNQVEGTMFYKAPEMDFGSTTVARDKVDMFAIGVLLYQQFTGKLPQRMIDYDVYDYQGEKWDIFNEPITINPQIDSKLNEVIVKLMKYNPKERYRSYNELINDLKMVERNIRNAGRPPKRY